MASLQDADGNAHGFRGGRRDDHGRPRADLIDKANKKMPTTFDELIEDRDAIQGRSAWPSPRTSCTTGTDPVSVGHGAGLKDPPVT